MKIATTNVFADKSGRLVDAGVAAASLVAIEGQEIRSDIIEKYKDDSESFRFFDSPRPVPSEDANPLPAPLLETNLPDTVSKLKGSGLAKLRSKLSGQYGIRLQSTGEVANPAQSRIIFQTLGASPENPYVITFDLHILTPFTGEDAQCDLIERDSTNEIVDDLDEVEGETLATSSEFTDGITTGNWSHFEKVITSDKTYGVKFVPGDTGDAVYSITARALYHTDPINMEDQ